jgi:hypothetical protein
MISNKPATAAGIPENSRARATARRKPQKAKRAPKATTGLKAKSTARPQTKQDQVLAMLREKGGTTVPDVMKATRWQKHSVHGFLSGVVRKKLQLKLQSTKVGDKRIYRIDSKTPPKASGRHSSRHSA